MVKVLYNDRLVYQAVIWMFWGLCMKGESSFKLYIISMHNKPDIDRISIIDSDVNVMYVLSKSYQDHSNNAFISLCSTMGRRTQIIENINLFKYGESGTHVYLVVNNWWLLYMVD